MNRKDTIFICILIAIIATIILCVALFTDKVAVNDPTVVGNTAGNLNNRGLFCENDGNVYFANPYDNGYLYVMNPDETGVKKLGNVSVESINADSNRIYYSLSGKSGGSGLGYIRKATGLYSIKKNGSDSICYTQDAVGIAALSGNYLYYQHYTNTTGTDLDKICIDKSGNHTVVENMVSPASVDSGVIYYAGASEDMYLYMLNTSSDTSSVLYEHQMYAPIYQNGYIYYMDLETKYQLHRYQLSTGEDVTLTKDRVDMFNVCSDMIYYQKDSSSPDAALMRMTTDGENPEVVMNGIFCDINTTSQYVYFHPYDSNETMYHQSLYGAVNPSAFAPLTDK